MSKSASLSRLFAALLPMTAPALAQAGTNEMGATAEACATPGDLPAPLASWSRPVPMRAVGKAGQLNRAKLTSGAAVTLALLPTPKVAYPLRPEKPGGSVSYGGLAQFTVTEGGIWRVGLSSGAWVDVVKDGKAATSVAHGHGPHCTGLRKMVDYNLSPGIYTLQVAANGSDSITVIVTRLP